MDHKDARVVRGVKDLMVLLLIKVVLVHKVGRVVLVIKDAKV